MTGPAPSFDDDTATGYAIEAAYQVNGAITLDCPQCDARPHEWCERAGRILKIPHGPRLGMAWRLNHPRGRRRHEAREQHLKEHRKTYKPGWT